MVSLYEVSIPTMIRGLQTLKTILAKAQQTPGLDLAALPATRLVDDMLPFSFQIQTCCNVAKKTVWRLKKDAGEDVPVPDDEKTVEELIARLDSTIALLEAFKPEEIKEETDSVDLKLGPRPVIVMPAKDYVLDFALANFFFHVQTAYCILRLKGVEVGKPDYLGAFMKAHMME